MTMELYAHVLPDMQQDRRYCLWVAGNMLSCEQELKRLFAGVL
jgi:hypothetical protein